MGGEFLVTPAERCIRPAKLHAVVANLVEIPRRIWRRLLERGSVEPPVILSQLRSSLDVRELPLVVVTPAGSPTIPGNRDITWRAL